MDELEIKIEQTKKDYYNVTIYKNNKMFFAELERSDIRHIIGVLDNAI
jgi:hypothetical protein